MRFLFSSTDHKEKEGTEVFSIIMQLSLKLLFILKLCLVVIPDSSRSRSFIGSPNGVDFSYRYDSEWLGWKAKHEKSYESNIHELEKYVTWISNSALIEAHNKLSSDFGYTLAMNQFGDLVRSCKTGSNLLLLLAQYRLHQNITTAQDASISIIIMQSTTTLKQRQRKMTKNST